MVILIILSAIVVVVMIVIVMKSFYDLSDSSDCNHIGCNHCSSDYSSYKDCTCDVILKGRP